MSILRAMYTGVTGINAEGDALGVIGDNIANVNTIGFKQQRGLFEDVLGHSIATSDGAGSGVRMSDVQQMFTQGSLSSTGVSTDLALSGDGFFVVHGSVDGLPGNYYTRAGQTQIDREGHLVTGSGMQVQGYAAQAGGAFATSLTTLKLPTSALPPLPTANLAITANLDASAAVPAGAWDQSTPGATSNFSTSISVYDSLGQSHTANVYFAKTAAGSWDYHALVDGADMAGGTAGTPIEIGSGTLAFSPSGALDSVTTNVPFAPSFVGAQPSQAMTLSLGTPTSTGGSGLDGITQFATPSSVSAQSQDGYGSGDLSGIAIDGGGVVRGIYSNGQKVAVGQLAIAKFRSNEGLGRAGQGLFTATRDSGEASIGVSGTGGRAAVSAGTLEQSNVDLAQQFVDLISHQRSFQANSKTITTADEMLQELVNLKR